jgi:DNA repair protein SbcD/Mre11
MKILHLSDIHMGSGFSHGRVNPATGLNTRLEDFERSMSRCIDRAIQEPVDLVLFGGDAFPNATPPPLVQEAFANQIMRLTSHQIPAVLLVGNHDQHAQGQAGSSLSIYRTLAVPGFIVADELTTHIVQTTGGQIQIVAIPWVNRSTLLTNTDMGQLSQEEVNQQVLNKLGLAIQAEVVKLDPKLPTIVLAHLMVENAKLGAEKTLAIGKGFTIPTSLLARSCFDYVALGHIHLHQNLNPTNDPPVVYPGSIDRVDFGEEKEDKGYVLIDVQPNTDVNVCQFQVHWEFCSLPVRPFLTVKVDVANAADPQAEIMEALQKADIRDSVVRLIYQIESWQSESIDTSEIHELLSISHSYRIQADIASQLTAPRIPALGSVADSPIDALAMYLENRPDLASIRGEMLEAVGKLSEA